MKIMRIVLDPDTASWVSAQEPNRRHWSRLVNAIIREEMEADKELQKEYDTEQAEQSRRVVELPRLSKLATTMELLYGHRHAKWPNSGKPLFDERSYSYIVEHRHDDDYNDLTPNQRRFLDRLKALLHAYLERCDPDVLSRPA